MNINYLALGMFVYSRISGLITGHPPETFFTVIWSAFYKDYICFEESSTKNAIVNGDYWFQTKKS